MSDPSHISELKAEVREKSKDGRTRTLLIVVLVLWLITLTALLALWINAYFKEKEKSQTLGQQITIACRGGDLGSDVSPEDVARICDTAKKIVEGQGEIQDSEVQESEIQEPEIQEEEIQEPEIQQPENQQEEAQDDETQDEEIQEPEIQDDETQEPEIDNPDPNDPPARVGTYNCPDGQYMKGFALNPDGTVSINCQDLPTMTPPGQQ